MDRAELNALADRIAMSAGMIDAATCDSLRQIREFDEVGGWHTMGAVSCAAWLSWRIGLSPGAARERVRVARALGRLPLMEASLGAGEISYSKVRAMTRVATPDNEEALLGMAKASTGGQLERICRFYRTAKRPDVESVSEEERKRWVSSRSTDDGMVRVTIQLCAGEAALFMKAINVSAAACDGDQSTGLLERLIADSLDIPPHLAPLLGHYLEKRAAARAGHRANCEVLRAGQKKSAADAALFLGFAGRA